MLDVWQAWMCREDLPREEEPLGHQRHRGPAAILRRLSHVRGRGRRRFQGPAEDGSANAARHHAAGLREDIHLQPLQELREAGRPSIIAIMSGIIKTESADYYYYYYY